MYTIQQIGELKEQLYIGWGKNIVCVLNVNIVGPAIVAATNNLLTYWIGVYTT